MNILAKCFLPFTVIALSNIAQADNLVAVADVWIPYTQADSNAQKGFLSDIVMEAMKASGHNVSYRSMPFQRCLESMDAGVVDLIIGVYAADIEPKKYAFDSNLPLAKSTNAFFTLKNNSWVYKNPKSLGNMKIGLAFGYDWGELNEPANAKKILVDWISDDNPLQKSIQKLLLGRIDTLVDDTLAVETEARRQGVWEKMRNAGTLGTPQKLFVAFSTSPKKPKAKIYSKALSDGIAKLKANGSYERILSKYNISN